VPEGPEDFLLIVQDVSAPVLDSTGLVTIADDEPPA
jgi:hypothetical protein